LDFGILSQLIEHRNKTLAHEAMSEKDLIGPNKESHPVAILQGLHPLLRDFLCCALTMGAIAMKRKQKLM